MYDSSEALPATAIRTAKWRGWFVVASAAYLFMAGSAQAQATTQEVVFRVGDNARIDWFAIDNPQVRGTLSVTGAHYDSTAQLNAAVVDVSRNRLIYDAVGDITEGYAINLNGLSLVQNGVTPVTTVDLGEWKGGGTNAGYRKTDGQVYFFVDKSLKLRSLDFGPTGLITDTGYTDIGKFNGPNQITGGDLDFDKDGSVWVAGVNGSGDGRLWNFAFTPPTLNLLSPALTVGSYYNGITFNAAGDTLYGYKFASGNYGIIDTTANGGGFSQILDENDKAFFGQKGDLATGTANITVLPESGVPSDYNNNSVVDTADYIAWRKGNNPLYNEVATIGSNTPEDYAEWRARFGNTSGSGSLFGGDTVPEPATLSLIFVALSALSARRRKSVLHNRG